MPAFFCEKSGLRLVAPGVSKLVDPINGVDEFKEPSEPMAKPEAADKSKSAPAVKAK